MQTNNVVNSTMCLVCGYDLGFTIPVAVAHSEICPSCGIQYGYSDSMGGVEEKKEKLYNLWREAWIKNAKKPLHKKEAKQIIALAMT